MIQDIKDKKVNMVIVKDSSRLGRDYIGFGEYVEKIFPENQVRLVSILDNYDSAIDNGVADTLPFRAVINDLYAKDISKKVKASKHKNAVNGLFNGNRPPYGYKISPDDRHKFVIDEENAKNLGRLFDLYLEGTALSQIAYTFNNEHISTPSQVSCTGRTVCPIWKPATIKHILKNRVYIRDMVQGKHKRINYKLNKRIKTDESEWIIVENTHEPIIDKLGALTPFLLFREKSLKPFFGSPREIFYSFFYNFCLNFRKSLNKKFKLFLFTIVIIYIIILLDFKIELANSLVAYANFFFCFYFFCN